VDEARRDFFNYSYSELAELLTQEFEASSFRATQLFEWVYRKGVTDVELMTNISRELRTKLASFFLFPKSRIADRRISVDGTRKYLFDVEGGALVESVMINRLYGDG